MLEYSPYQKDITRLFQDGLDLERLRDKTILVVGATGLVGGCIVDVLMQNPARCYKVIAAGRNKERAQQKFAAYWDYCLSVGEHPLERGVGGQGRLCAQPQ